MFFAKKIAAQTSIALICLLVSLSLANAQTQRGLELEDDTLTKTVLIHPVLKTDENEGIASGEHEYRSKLQLGDQLARDFSIAKITDNGIARRFKNDGQTNEDWYGWRAEVMAPFDSKVLKVNHPYSANKPGVMDREAPTGYIMFQNEDNTKVVYAHVREIEVEPGDRVKAGEVVAKVGNNGTSRSPHVHVGAWKDDMPLQIQVDLYAEQRNKKEKKQDSK